MATAPLPGPSLSSVRLERSTPQRGRSRRPCGRQSGHEPGHSYPSIVAGLLYLATLILVRRSATPSRPAILLLTTLSTYALPMGLRGWAENPAIAWDASGTLWLAYVIDDGGPKRLVVDKRSDGKTWSGAQLVNGPEGNVTTGYGWPGPLVDGAVSVYSPHHVDSLENEQFDVIRLTP